MLCTRTVSPPLIPFKPLSCTRPCTTAHPKHSPAPPPVPSNQINETTNRYHEQTSSLLRQSRTSTLSSAWAIRGLATAAEPYDVAVIGGGTSIHSHSIAASKEEADTPRAFLFPFLLSLPARSLDPSPSPSPLISHVYVSSQAQAATSPPSKPPNSVSKPSVSRNEGLWVGLV